MHNLIQIQRTSFFTLFCGVCVFYKPIERHWDSTLPAKVMGYFNAFLLDCILDTYCIATNGKKKFFAVSFNTMWRRWSEGCWERTNVFWRLRNDLCGWLGLDWGYSRHWGGAVFRVVVKGEPGLKEPGSLKLMGIVDKGASFIALNRGTKY